MRWLLEGYTQKLGREELIKQKRPQASDLVSFFKFWMQLTNNFNWLAPNQIKQTPFLPWHFPPAQLRKLHGVQIIVTPKTNI